MRVVKEIKSRTGELHFRRYALYESTYLSIYFHEIYKADEDPYLHNHPWRLFSWILWGSYIEELTHFDEETAYDIDTPDPVTKEVTRTPGHFGYRGFKAFHKIKKVLTPVVLTLAVCIGKRRPWHYLATNVLISNDDFRKQKLGSYVPDDSGRKS